MYTEYCSNNSGGSWWLTDEDWRALERAGWKICWADLQPTPALGGDGMPVLIPYEGLFQTSSDDPKRWLGALAKRAFRLLPVAEATAEWEQVVHQSATEGGCECCGPPHEFYEYK